VREQKRHIPVNAAVQNKDVDMVRALLYGGADLTLQGNDGKTALDLAINSGDEKVTILLREGITKRFKLKRE